MVKVMSSEAIFGFLVGFDTTSCYSNLALIEWIEDYLRGYGVASHIIYSEDRGKANLFATIGGVGGVGGVVDKVGGVALSGHSDVVPVLGQDWSTPPFELSKRDGRYYGRGTCDMKGFISVVLSRVPYMLEQDLLTPIHLAFSYDEEIGCYGAPRMISHFGKDFMRPKVVIVGEPSDMQVVSAHKGQNHFHTRVTGLPRHSSQTHLGVNSIFYAGRLIEALRLIGVERSERGDIECGFEPPYSSVNVGTISGGIAENIIPEHCDFAWECRSLPGDDADKILRPFFDLQSELDSEMRGKHDGCGIETSRASTPAFYEDLQSPAELLVRGLTGDNEVRYVAYATEAGQFQDAGCSVVICGPGSIDQAHRPDEFLSVEQLEKCEDFVDRLIEHCRKHEV